MNHGGMFEAILVLLTSAVVVTTVFRRLNLSTVLGYLVVGFAVGPYGFGVLTQSQSTQNLAEFGIVFLMFTIGLEFSLSKLLAMKKQVLGLGGLQVGITTLIVMGISMLYGAKVTSALVIGGVMAMSSTAICMKQLGDQLEVNSPHGHNALGILLFQDIAVIPFIILIPSLAGDHSAVLPLLMWALLKGTLVMILILFAGRWVLRPVFTEIASTRSLELFTLTILLVTLGCAWLTEEMGLSLALGAFLAGMMLGETQFRHQIEIEIRPFRDVLLGLFFITVGMMLNIQELPEIWARVLILLVVIVVFKMVLISVLSRLFGSEKNTSLRTGIVLAQGGEFGFALLTISISQNILPLEQTQVVLGALIFSMALSPFLIRYNEKLARFILPKASKTSEQEIQRGIAATAGTLQQHVIICGYGRVGQNIARFLEAEGYEYIALDLDPIRVQNAQLAGERVNFGDSANIHRLRAAGLRRAKALILSFDDAHATMRILPQVRKENPDIPILVRTRDDTDLLRFQEAGATEVIPETLEASLMLAFHVLILMGVPTLRAMRHIRTTRNNRYSLLRQIFPSQELEDIEEIEPKKEQLHAVTINKGAFAIGKTLAELRLEAYDVAVTAVRRCGIRGLEPSAETIVREEDVLVLYGAANNIDIAEKYLLHGS